MGRIRIDGNRNADGRLKSLTFSKGQGSFTLPVRGETTAEDDATTQQHDERRRMTYAEWCDAVEDWRQEDAQVNAIDDEKNR